MNNGNQKIKIDRDVKEFAKADFKKFKKHNKGYYDKKEIKEQYAQYLIELLPEVILFLVNQGHLKDQEVQRVKLECQKKIADPDFIKLIKKEVKKGNEIPNLRLFPIICKELLTDTKAYNDKVLAEGGTEKDTFDMSDVAELSRLILKKKIKKMTENGVPEDLAFDVLSIIPFKGAIKNSRFYRIKSFFDCVYEHAKDKEFKFDEVVNAIIDEEYIPVAIAFALLERKEKFGKLNETQKACYLDISNWCFATMEKMNAKLLEDTIVTYIKGRKRDEEQKKDGNRRYALITLSETDYPRIVKTIEKVVSRNEEYKKYLN